MKKSILILGGVRSGKSRYAVELAQSLSEKVMFVATAQMGDDEMRARVRAHQAERNPDWITLEAPHHLGEKISQVHTPFEVILIDCMSLLVSNVMMTLPEDATEIDVHAALTLEFNAMQKAYVEGQASCIIVSNEVGMGLVPPYPSGRVFRDSLGRLNQQLAAWMDEVYLLVAGIPMKIK